MRRKSLLLLLTGPLLLVILLSQLADVQAARLQPVNQGPTVDEGAGGVPLTQPLSIRIRQQIPITLPFVLFQGEPLTAPLTISAAAASQLGAEPATAGLGKSDDASPAKASDDAQAALPGDVLAVTPTAALTAVGEALTVTAVPVVVPQGESATDALTETAPSETAPSETAPSETAPSETALSETALSETALARSAPATETTAPTGVLPLLALPVAPLSASTEATTTEDVADVAPPPSLFLTTGLTSTPALLPSLGLTLDLDIQVLITDTMTSTVPATVIVRLTGLPTFTVPITLAISPPPATALVNVVPVTLTEELTIPTLSLTDALTISQVVTVTPALTETGDVTSTEEVTAEIEATPTVPAELAVVTFTVPLTTNVRIEPTVDAEIVRRAGPGEVLSIVAQNRAGDWYLLQEGNWVALIALGEEIPGLPVADDRLVTALRAEAARATPTPTPTPAPPTPTPVVTPFAPVTVTTTTNANLRAGPGTTFDIVANTELGQAIVIVERNDAGDWLRLQDGSWISAPLVQGAPPLASIPVFDPNATPTPTPTATPTPIAATEVTTTVTSTSTSDGPTTAVTTTTPGPVAPALPTPTPRPPSLTVDENLYLVDFDGVSSNYDRALSAVDRLVDSASGNAAVFADPQWQTDMNTAIQLIRRAGQDVAAMVVPERFAAAHNSLVAAAALYNTAADSLAAGLQAGDVTLFENAFTNITRGDASMSQAAAAVNAFRP